LQFRSEPQICVTVFLLNLSEEEIRESADLRKSLESDRLLLS